MGDRQIKNLRLKYTHCVCVGGVSELLSRANSLQLHGL